MRGQSTDEPHNRAAKAYAEGDGLSTVSIDYMWMHNTDEHANASDAMRDMPILVIVDKKTTYTASRVVVCTEAHGYAILRIRTTFDLM